LAVSAAGTITLAVLLRLIGATHLGGYGITHQVKAAGEVDTQLIINNMHKASLDVGEFLSQLDEGTVDEGLILSLAGWGTSNMDKEN